VAKPNHILSFLCVYHSNTACVYLYGIFMVFTQQSNNDRFSTSTLLHVPIQPVSQSLTVSKDQEVCSVQNTRH